MIQNINKVEQDGARNWSLSSSADSVSAYRPTVATVTQTTGIATTGSGSTIALATNSATRLLTIQNTSASGNLYIGIGAPATISSFYFAPNGGGYEFPVIPAQAIYLLGSTNVSYSILSA